MPEPKTQDQRAIEYAKGVMIGTLSEMEEIHGRVLEYCLTDADISSAIEKCMKRNASVGLPFEQFVRYDPNEIRKPGDTIFGPFDAIVFRNLQNSPSPGGQIAEFRQWLKPGGALLLEFPVRWGLGAFTAYPYSQETPELWRFTDDCIRGLFGVAKFSVERIHVYADETLGVAVGYALGMAH